jgi:hypothetical protein
VQERRTVLSNARRLQASPCRGRQIGTIRMTGGGFHLPVSASEPWCVEPHRMIGVVFIIVIMGTIYPIISMRRAISRFTMSM